MNQVQNEIETTATEMKRAGEKRQTEFTVRCHIHIILNAYD